MRLLNKLLRFCHLLFLKIRYGKRIKIGGKVSAPFNMDFIINGQLILRGRVVFGSGSLICSSTKESELYIGDNVYFGRNNIIVSHKQITIGDNCMFGPNVTIYDHDHRIENGVVQHNQYSEESVTIEEGCWLGAGVIVLRGTKIGAHSVIGAGTVVKGEIPPNSLIYNHQDLILRKISI